MRRASPPFRPHRGRPRPPAAATALALTALAAAVWLAGAGPAAAAHPFYEEQLRRGAAAFDRGAHAEAAEALRLASFGLLGEPPALAECMARLALARHALGESTGARQAVERVLELEERFGAYRAAALPEPVETAFDELAAATVPTERLAGLPAFAEPASRRLENELAELAPAARRRRLEELLAAEPGEPRWALLLGRLEMADKSFARAAELAGRVLAAEPESQAGLCLRGLARAGAGDCAGAADDLAACDQSRTEAAVAITRLDCLAELERWAEARDLAASLPPAVRADRQVARLERRAVKNAPEQRPATAGAAAGADPVTGQEPAAAAEEPPADGVTPPAASRPAPAMSAEDAARLESARVQIAAARNTDDLAQAWDLARDVADRNPGSTDAQHLAAEIAYRSSRWPEAVDYFRRGGEPPRPERRFYFAVALYEAGETEAAADMLARALPGLRRTPFVQSYAERILDSASPP